MTADPAVPDARPLTPGDPTSGRLRQLRVELGRELIEAGRIAEGSASLRVALDEPGEDPDDGVINFELGKALIGSDRASALDHLLSAAYEAAKQSSPDGSLMTSLLEMVTSLLETKPPNTPTEQSLDALAQSITSVADPLAVRASTLLGNSYLALEKLDAALQSFRVVGAHAPDKAIEKYNLMLETDPESVEVRMARADAWLELGETDRAASDLEEALALAATSAPKGPVGQLNQQLGELYVDAEEYALAVERLDAAVVDDEQSRRRRILRAEARLGSGDLRGSLEDLDLLDLASAASGDQRVGTVELDLLQLRAQALLALGDVAAAAAVVEEIGQRDPAGTDTLIVRAQLMLRGDGKVSDARELLTLAAEGRRKRPREVARMLLAPRAGLADDQQFDWFMAEYHFAHAQVLGEARAGSKGETRHRELATEHVRRLSDDRDQDPRLIGSLLHLTAELGLSSDESDTLRDAAAQFQVAEDWAAVVAVLERAQRVRPLEHSLMWVLSDSYSAGSSDRRDDESRRDWIRLGVQWWDQAFAQGFPEPDDRWAFATRAVLAAEEGKLDRAQQLVHVWRAICHQEIALAAEVRPLRRLLQLCDLFDSADLPRAHHDAAARAAEIDAADVDVLWQLGLGRVKVVDTAGAHTVAEHLRALAGDETGDDARFLRIQADLLDAAIALIRREPEALRESVSTLRGLLDEFGDSGSLRSAVAQMLDALDDPGALDEWQRVEEIIAQNQRDGVDEDGPATHAEALLHLGRTQEALDECARELATMALERDTMLDTAGLCSIILGHLDDGIHRLQQVIDGVTVPWSLDDLVRRVRRMDSSEADRTHHDAWTEIERRAHERREALRALDDQALFDCELQLLSTVVGHEDGGDWARLAAALIGARVSWQRGDLSGSITALDDLHDLPERERALAVAAAGIYRERRRGIKLDGALADLVERSDPDAALAAFVDVLDDAGDDADDVRALAGFAAFASGEHALGHRLTTSAIGVIGAERVAMRWQSVITDGARWSEALAWLRDCAGEDLSQESFDAFGLALDRLLGLDDQLDPGEPQPIAVSLGATMLPDDPYDPEWPFIGEWLLAMRHDIFADTGIVVPPVRARGNDWPEHFSIELNAWSSSAGTSPRASDTSPTHRTGRRPRSSRRGPTRWSTRPASSSIAPKPTTSGSMPIRCGSWSAGSIAPFAPTSTAS